MAEPKFTIQVETPANTAGAKEAAAELKRVEQQAKATAAALDKLTEADRRKASSAAESASIFKKASRNRNETEDQATYLGNLTKEAKAVGMVEQATAKATLSKRAFLDGLKKLGQEVPLVGFALNAFRNPLTMVGIGAAYAVNWVREFTAGIDELAKAIKDFGGAKITLAQFNEILYAGKGRADEFARALREISGRGKTVEETFAEANQNISRQMGFERERAGNQKSKELDNIDAAVRSGRMSPEEGEARKQAVDAKFADQERQLRIEETRRQAVVAASARYKARREAEDLEQGSGRDEALVQRRAAEKAQRDLDFTNAQKVLEVFDKGPLGLVLAELNEKAELQKLPAGMEADRQRYADIRAGLVNGVGVAGGAAAQAANMLDSASSVAGENKARALRAREQERAYGQQFDQLELGRRQTDSFYNAEYPTYQSEGERAGGNAFAQRRAEGIISNNARVSLQNSAQEVVKELNAGWGSLLKAIQDLNKRIDRLQSSE